jgi:hypothetical protein
MNGPRPRVGSHPFEGYSDGEIVELVAVEVSHGQGEAEPVVSFRDVIHRAGVLMEELIAERRQTRPPDSIENVDRARIEDTPQVLERDADGEVLGAVIVEVARRHDPAEIVVRLHRIQELRARVR